MLYTTRFFMIGEQQPSLSSHSIKNHSIYDSFAESIIWHVKSEEVNQFEAMDRLELVELVTPDERDSVEAIFIDGELVGSIGAPFIFPVDQYITYEKLDELQGA